MNRAILCGSPSIKWGHLFQKLAAFTHVADIMRRLDILFRMRSKTAKRDDMIKMQLAARKNRPFADVAMHPISLKNMLITDGISMRILLSGFASLVIFMYFQRIFLFPPFVVLSPFIKMTDMIFFVSLSSLFNISRATFSALSLLFIFMISVIITAVLLRLFSVSIAIMLYLLVMCHAVISALLWMACIEISLLLAYPLAIALTIALIYGLFSFWIACVVVLLLSSKAIFASKGKSVFAFLTFAKLIKRLFIATFSANFRGEQGKLMGVVQFTHDRSHFLSSSPGMYQHRRGNTILPHQYTTNPLHKQLYASFCYAKGGA